MTGRESKLLYKLLFWGILRSQWKALLAATISVSLAIGLALAIRLGTQSARLTLDQNLSSLESQEWIGPIEITPAVSLSQSAGELGMITAGRSFRFAQIKNLTLQDKRSFRITLFWPGNETNSETQSLESVIGVESSEVAVFVAPGCEPRDPKSSVTLGNTTQVVTFREHASLQGASCATGVGSGRLWSLNFPQEKLSPHQIFLQPNATDGDSKDFRANLFRSLLSSASLSYIPKETQLADLDKLTQSLNTNLQIMGLVTLFIALFMVHHVFKLILTRNAKNLAILKSLGIGLPKQLPCLIALAITLGLLSSLLGCLVGLTLGKALSTITQLTVQNLYDKRIDPSLFQWDSVEFLRAIVFGIGTALLGCAGPLLKLRTLNTAEVLRTGMWHEVEQTKPSAVSLVFLALTGIGVGLLLKYPVVYQRLPLGAFASCLLVLLVSAWIAKWSSFALYFLAFKAGAKNSFFKEFRIFVPPQSAIVVQVLSLCFALTISIKIMSESFRFSLEEWVGETLKADIWIRSNSKSRESFPTALINRIDTYATSQGAQIDGLRVLRAKFKGNQNAPELPIVAKAVRLSVQSKVEPLRMLAFNNGEKPEPQSLLSQRIVDTASGCGIIIQNPCAAYVSLPLSVHAKMQNQKDFVFQVEVDKAVFHFKAVGYFQDFANDEGSILTDRGILERLSQTQLDPHFMNMYLPLGNRPNVETIRQEIQDFVAAKQIPEVEVITLSELRQEIVRAFEQTFRITDALYLLSGGVALVAVLSSLGLQILLRTKEWNILWALVWTPKQMEQKLKFWAAWKASWSVVAALPGGIITGLILVYIVNYHSFGFALSFSFPWTFVLLLFPLSWCTGFLGAKIVCHNLKKSLGSSELNFE